MSHKECNIDLDNKKNVTITTQTLTTPSKFSQLITTIIFPTIMATETNKKNTLNLNLFFETIVNLFRNFFCILLKRLRIEIHKSYR